MTRPYVTKVTVKNEQIMLKIGVDEFTPGETLEISGHATQTGGAFAVFYDIQLVPEKDPDGEAYIWVKAPPSQDFKKGHAVTVVLRAARVWTTVLGEAPPEPGSSPGQTESATLQGLAQLPQSQGSDESADEDTNWNDVRAVIYAGPSSLGNAGQTLIRGGASFQPGS